MSWPDALRALYEAPLERFVATRKELARALRLAGDAAAGERLLALAKPTRTAWALNQVARRQGGVVQAVFDARDAAVRAQRGAGAEEVRATVRAFRERVADAVQAAREVSEQAGFELNAIQQRRVSESLQASSAGDSDVRARLLAGELSQDVDVEDPFAGIEAAEGRARQDAATTPEAGAARGRNARSAPESKAATARADRERARQAREEEERRRLVDEAKQRVVSLDEQAREARKRAHEAQVVARRAQAEADRADRVVAEAEKRLEAARADLQSRTTARTIGKTS